MMAADRRHPVHDPLLAGAPVVGPLVVSALRLVACLAGFASALPLLLGKGGIDSFVIEVAAGPFVPFALLMVLGRLSLAARWLGLAVAFVLQALAYYEVVRPGQSEAWRRSSSSSCPSI